MNVYAMDTVGDPNHIGKSVSLKLNKELELGISVCLSVSTEFWFQACVEATSDWTTQREQDCNDMYAVVTCCQPARAFINPANRVCYMGRS